MILEQHCTANADHTASEYVHRHHVAAPIGGEQRSRHERRRTASNDRGELIIARLTPGGYEEISRTTLIKPTTPPENRRELVNVNWVHPAYANKHLYTRNDEEIICVSLAADGK